MGIITDVDLTVKDGKGCFSIERFFIMENTTKGDCSWAMKE